MNSSKFKPYYLSLILLTINLLGLITFSYNLIKINNIQEVIDSHSDINKINQKYLEGLRNIHSSVIKINNPHLIEFEDDFVFDSSLEAIVFREMVKKIGLSGSDYEVREELKVIESSNYGDIAQITLGYSFQEISFSKMIELFDLVIKNNRYDYLNNIGISKRTNELLLNINFDYTNLGLVSE